MTGPEDNVLVTIITDGYENCSREYNLSMIKNLIEKLKEQKWTFTFIGTDNLDVEGMARNMCIDNALSFAQTAEGTKQMFVEDLGARERYCEYVDEGIEMERGSFFDV